MVFGGCLGCVCLLYRYVCGSGWLFIVYVGSVVESLSSFLLLSLSILLSASHGFSFLQ